MSLRTPAGEVLPEGDWKEVRLPTIVIHYLAGQEAEARAHGGYFAAIHDALVREFPQHNVQGLMTHGGSCHAYLHVQPHRRAGPGSATTMVASGRKNYCEIHLLPASALPFQQRCCTKSGELRDGNSDARTAAHEYAGILLLRVHSAGTSGWGLHDAPQWFVQGYEEYLATTLLGQHGRAVTLPAYIKMVREAPSRIGFDVQDPYTDGAVLLAFMHEEFGAPRVQALLSSPMPTFGAAMIGTLGVTGEEFEKRWHAWRAKRLTADGDGAP